jgi:dephospho-CoA kinase
MSCQRRLRVGLTGGLAAGKSTVATLLAEAGCTVVDADHLVADLYRPGEPGALAVRESFGAGLMTPDGGVDRRALAEKVFSDPAARRLLESTIHPLVRRRFEEIAAAREGIVVLEAALLAEAGWSSEFDLLVTVEAPRELRVRRAVARGMHREEAERRLAAQADDAVRRRQADYVLENDGSLEHLRRQVEELTSELRRRLERLSVQAVVPRSEPGIPPPQER